MPDNQQQAEAADPLLSRDRFTPFFAVGFAVVTLADIGTTYICVHHLGLGEANPFTDTSSFWGLLWPELIAWVIGCAFVWIGFRIGRRYTFAGVNSDCRFALFRRRLLSPRGLPFAILVVVPIALVLGRLVPVAGNTSFLIFGSDPYDELLAWLIARYDFSVYATHMAVQCCLLALFAIAGIWLVFRLAKKR